MSQEHRGTGNVFRPKYAPPKTKYEDARNAGTLRESAVWWVRYNYRGKLHRECSGSTNRTDAVRLLKRRLGEIGRGQVIGPDVSRTTFEDLTAMLLNDYKANGRKSLDRATHAVNRLQERLAGVRACDITADRVTAYVAARLGEGAANATVNRELAALKRMLRLGEIAGKVTQRPILSSLHEHNTRTGFFEEPEFRAVQAHLPADLKLLFEVAYVTGWRVKSELLTRQWSHVDFKSGWLRLEPGETKNDEGRMFPLTPELRAVLDRQLARTREVERATGQIIPWVFHRDGASIVDYRRAWRSAVKRAGLPHRIPHDFRRTAVRNLERAGVPRSTAMKMVGHRTEAIYRRYAIADESMLREGAEKLSALHQAERGASHVVVPLSPR
ncbi:MAG TPA: site-specific integrase [Methylomirabilota bacterium]|jgi:integrase|nr:site-specific integrase [Methylomirabilota bacterium]